MSIYVYRARNNRGKVMEGIVEAANEETAAGLLSEKRLTVVALEKRGTARSGGFDLKFLHHVSNKDLVVFYRQLSVMIDASLPIMRALRILIKQTSNDYLKAVIAAVADEVEGGSKLSKAMESFPDVFSNFAVNILASGETSGRLSEVMNYLADQQEKDYDLISKVRGAMIYPAIIVSGMVVVGFIVMIFVIPQMTTMLEETGATLPLTTRILIGVSGFLKDFWWLAIIVLVSLFIGVSVLNKRSVKGKRFFDLMKIKIPVFGRIFKHIYIARMTRSLSTLIRGGVPVARALEAVQEVVSNEVYKEVLAETIKDVDEGSTVADSFALSKYMPEMVPQMIKVGEETGKLEEILEKLTDFYTREVDNQVANLSTLIEPIIMIILGVAIGGFVAAIIMPMWQLSSSF